ncbi:MAG: phosphoglycerate dehydrogenase, partial [Planctomycetota bacterium]
GPLAEADLLPLLGDVDGIICGDDAFTRKALQKCLPKLKVLSKYGIGVDKIDIAAATDLGIPVTYCPGVNHTTVAEHAFGLLIGLLRHIPEEAAIVKKGEWKRLTGNELWGKTIGIIGLGRIGKEVATRAIAFGMNVVAFDVFWDEAFAKANNVRKAASAEDVLKEGDVITFHMNLSKENREFLNAKRIGLLKKGAVVVNTARGGLVNEKDVAEALGNGKLAGYATDVVDPEPIAKENPLLSAPNVVITPHIASRTYESVERQATMAAENLIRVIKGEKPLAQVNELKKKA